MWSVTSQTEQVNNEEEENHSIKQQKQQQLADQVITPTLMTYNHRYTHTFAIVDAALDIDVGEC